MPRNYKNEMQWQRGRYKQLLFHARIEEAEGFKKHLEMHGIRPIDWFRYALSLELVPPDNSIVSGVAADTGNSITTEVAADIGNSIMPEAVPPVGAVKKKRRTPSPSAETVRQWVQMHRGGMSYNAIAAASAGYDGSTVRKRVMKELAKDDAGNSAD